MSEIFVHARMRYYCPKCGHAFWMYLEKGLEEPGPDHKPVPFAIPCACGGFAHDVSGIVQLSGTEKYQLLPDDSNLYWYFANTKDSDCGVPITPWTRRKK